MDRWTMVTRVGTASRRGALSLAVALVFASSAHARAAAPEPASTETSAAPTQAARVDLNLSALEPIDPSVRADLAKRIHATIEPVVHAFGLPPEKIHLVVGWRDADAFDYTLDIAFDAHAGVAASKHEVSSGPNTEQGELAELAAAVLDRFLRDWKNEYEALHPPPPNPDEHPYVAEERPTDLPPPRALGRVGWTGVGLLVAGVAVAATGGALLGVDRTPHPDEASKLRDWQPAGYGLLATGGALVVTGVVMTVVDAVPRARARRSAKNAAITPALGPTHAGAVLRFRF